MEHNPRNFVAVKAEHAADRENGGMKEGEWFV